MSEATNVEALIADLRSWDEDDFPHSIVSRFRAAADAIEARVPVQDEASEDRRWHLAAAGRLVAEPSEREYGVKWVLTEGEPVTDVSTSIDGAKETDEFQGEYTRLVYREVSPWLPVERSES